MEKISKYCKLELLFVVIIIAVGILLRTKVYLTNLPFWVDEDALLRSAKGILEWKYPCFRGLENEYSTPLFLLFLSFFYKIWGFNEAALRIVPFIASIITLLSIAILAKKTIRTPFLFLLPLIYITFNEQLLFYTQYCKFYSTDFLCFILISILVFSVKYEETNKRKIIFYSVLAAIFSWCAYSAIFYIIGICFFLFVRLIYNILFYKSDSDENKLNIKEKFLLNKTHLINWIIFTVPSVIFILIYSIEVFLRRTNYDGYLKQAWHELGNYFPQNLNDISCLFFYHTTVYPDNKILLFWGIIISLGMFVIWKKYKFRLVLFLSAMIVMLVLGALELYPFIERQTLFLMTLLLIISVNAIDFSFWIKINKKLIIIPMVAFTMLIMIFKYYDFNYLNEVWNNKDYYRMSTAREFYKFIEQEYEKGDMIYSQGRDASLRIYDLDKNIIDFYNDIEEVAEFDKFLENADKNRNIHIYLYKYPYIAEKYDINKKLIEDKGIKIKEIKDGKGTYIKFRIK